MAGLVDALSCASLHGGGTVSFAVGSNSGGVFKVESFNARPRVEGEGAPKLQTQGRWPSFLDPREMIVDLEGKLVGSSPSDYWTKRSDLLDAIVPPAGYTRTVREHSKLTATFPGQSAVYLDVCLLDYDFPVTSQLGRASDYRFSWVAYFGYWRTVSGDTPVRL